MYSRKLTFLFSIVLTLLSAYTSALGEDSIRIGAVLNLTGDGGPQSNGFREGIELGIEEINAQGINGRKIQLYLEDGKGLNRISFSAGSKLLNLNKVVATLFDSHMEALGSGPMFERAHVPALVLWDSNPEIENVGDYIFSIGPWTLSAADVAVSFAQKQWQAKSAIIINHEEPWSEKVSAMFRKEFEEKGGKIINTFSFHPDDTDFRPALIKVKQLKPDFVYTPLAYNTVAFYTQAYEAKLGIPLVSSDMINEGQIAEAQDAFQGIYQSNLAVPDTKMYQHLEELYVKKFNRKPPFPWFVACGYDGINLLAEAIRRGGVDSKKIKETLYSIKNFPGASSTISFNEKGSSPQYEVMYRIHGAGFIREP